MPAGPDQAWVAGAFNPPVAGPFETIPPMEWSTFSHVPPNWAFLDDGEATITLSGGPGGVLLDCSAFNDPSLTVTEATLLLDADFPVPAAKPTWGGIKSMYRRSGAHRPKTIVATFARR